MNKWDLRWLELATHISQWSKDPSTKVGCVIANGKHETCKGFNGFPEQVNDSNERYNDREQKHKFVIHAEKNAIYQAECSLRGHTIYNTLIPCSECAKAIIQKGIRRVFCWYVAGDVSRSAQFDFETTFKMFGEAGVVLNLVNHHTREVQIQCLPSEYSTLYSRLLEWKS